jgi:hypothetical protein
MRPEVGFSSLTFEPELRPLHDGDCGAFGRLESDAIDYILRLGSWVTVQEAHEHFGWSGCSVAGAVVRSGEQVAFEFDLAGLITFAHGSLLVCKDACCAGDFPSLQLG